MKAVLLRAYGGVDQLTYEDVPQPAAQRGEVLVRTIAISINPIDFKIRRGDMKERLKLTFPAMLGRDLVGTVVALGEGVTSLAEGQIVFGFVNHTYAEYVACRADELAVLPAGLDPVDAAALPLVLSTGSQLIESGVQARPGQTILITGTLGSVGRTAAHVARQHGAEVVAGVRRSEIKDAAAIGAHSVVAVDDESSIGDLREVDGIADTIGQQVVDKLVSKIKSNGVLASVVGSTAAVSRPDIRVAGVFAHADPSRLWQLASDVAAGKFTVPIGRHMKIAQIREAHQAAESGGAGKIVLTP